MITLRCYLNRAFLVSLSALLLIAILVTSTAFALKALTLLQGSSKILVFTKMRKVVVIDPNIADVVIASRSELVVFGKSVGHTKLYVWDAKGRHEYSITVRAAESATALVRRLRDLLPEYVQARAMGDKIVVLQGVCPGKAQYQKAVQVAKQLAGEQFTVIDLLAIKGEQTPPAERAAQQLRQLYGPDYEYVVWGERTVIVRGPLDDAMVEELQKLDEALGNEVKVAAVRTVQAVAPPPVEEIAKAVGREYKVWVLGSGTVVVEGEAPNQAAAERVSKLLEAFATRAQIINLVRVAPEPKPSAAEYVKLLQAALGEQFIVRQVAESAIAVEGTVTDKADLEKVKQLVSLVGNHVRVLNLVRQVEPRKKQIVVHIKVVDLNRDMIRKFGVDWGQLVQGALAGQPFLVRVEGGVDNVYDLAANLEAMEEKKYAKILAEPNLVVNDGEEATILVGGEIPIPVAQPGATGFASITVEWKPFGVTLKVKPRITADGQIETEVSPEVSSIDYSVGVTIGGMTIPGMRTRRSSTKVTVPSGATLIIGGLIKHEESKLIRKIPLLGDIPIIGELFKRREFIEGKSELVIFLTPEIMKPLKEGGP